MALDSYKIRKTENVKEIKEHPTMSELDERMRELSELIDSLTSDDSVGKNSDIDQEWIKENEGAESKSILKGQSSSTSQDEREEEQKLFDEIEKPLLLNKIAKVSKDLDDLLSTFPKQVQKEQDLKNADREVNQLVKNLEILRKYQNELENKYGKYWFAKMTEEEKEEYIKLYSSTHNVSKESVAEDIERSIVLAYQEKVDELAKQEAFKGEHEAEIKFYIKQEVDNLKQIYSQLGNATPEQIQNFKNVYDSLSSLSKIKPKSLEEEQQKLKNLEDIMVQIYELKLNLNTVTQAR